MLGRICTYACKDLNATRDQFVEEAKNLLAPPPSFKEAYDAAMAAVAKLRCETEKLPAAKPAKEVIVLEE